VLPFDDVDFALPLDDEERLELDFPDVDFLERFPDEAFRDFFRDGLVDLERRGVRAFTGDLERRLPVVLERYDLVEDLPDRLVLLDFVEDEERDELDFLLDFLLLDLERRLPLVFEGAPYIATKVFPFLVCLPSNRFR
jgi:hypothetical protein